MNLRLIKEDKKTKVIRNIVISTILIDAITTFIIVGKNGGLEKNLILYLIYHYIKNLAMAIITWTMIYILLIFGLELILKYYNLEKEYRTLLLVYLILFMFFTLVGNIMFIVIFYLK